MEKEKKIKKKLLLKFFKAHSEATEDPDKNQEIEKLKKDFQENGNYESEQELLKEAALLLKQ
jgi:hypothetical protein